MTSQLTNILRNAARPGYLFTMAQKVALRADDYLHRSDSSAVRRWCAARAESVEDYALARNADAWREAEQFSAEFTSHAEQKLKSVGVTLGGGGHYTLLYFLTRWRSPRVVLETGVAAGFSSAAILTALERCAAGGRLLSSDFPYFRLEQPERFIGCLVDEPLRRHWRLEIKGDRANLPRLLREAQRVDLFHYDSDKSHYGRRWAMRQVAPKLAPNAIVLMDDIQDNWYFREETERRGAAFRVFEFHKKYLGLIELESAPSGS